MNSKVAANPKGYMKRRWLEQMKQGEMQLLRCVRGEIVVGLLDNLAGLLLQLM